ncbi:hypothetical protein KXR64_21820 [Brucella intermedia]|uniref:hypothetical protein n=1 Tax=Brucella TaxID=234 RepID=UPI0009462E16|nr:hypothetical protein [Brucella intermedia]
MAGKQAARLRQLDAKRQRYRAILSILKGRAVRRYYNKLMEKNTEEIIALGGNPRDFDEARGTEATAWVKWMGKTTRMPVLGLKGYPAKGDLKDGARKRQSKVHDADQAQPDKARIEHEASTGLTDEPGKGG